MLCCLLWFVVSHYRRDKAYQDSSANHVKKAITVNIIKIITTTMSVALVKTGIARTVIRTVTGERYALQIYIKIATD
jgi:hypothetical protein